MKQILLLALGLSLVFMACEQKEEPLPIDKAINFSALEAGQTSSDILAIVEP